MDTAKYAVLDDLAKWRDPVLCLELLFAGVGYLYDKLEKPQGREYPLRERIRRLASFAQRMQAASPNAGLPDGIELYEYRRNVWDLDEFGTIGYGLWHLRPYEDSPAFRDRFKVLAASEPNGGDRNANPQLRGVGFEFVCAGVLAREGFSIEFIPSAANEPRPDFFARRDGHTFPCEATSKYPTVPAAKTPEDFWDRLVAVAEVKMAQLAKDKYPDGVLHVDCTPIFGTMTEGAIPIGGTAHYLPADGKGPGGSVPVIRYDASPFSIGLRRFGAAIEKSSITTLVLWNRLLKVTPEATRRSIQHCVLGTMRGNRFWSYFPKAVVFPGSSVEIVW